MAVEPGTIVEGKVVKLLKFGVIVELPGGDSGLIHISEIADQYVHEVSDFFKEQDMVKVKVLGRREEGRYELSAKQAEPRQPLPDAPQRSASHDRGGHGGGSDDRSHGDRGDRGGHGHGDRDRDRERIRSGGGTFEERLADFLKESNRKISELKRDRDGKRRGRK